MRLVAMNVLVVLLAALAATVLGVAWYSQTLFSKVWSKAHTYTEEKMGTQAEPSANRAHLITIVCYLIMALMFSLLIGYIGVTTVLGGMWLGFILWLGFAFTTGLTRSLFSERTVSSFLIDASYQLVYLLIMGALLAGWR
ncbi:MAG: DUF1761 domain-containing protein [Anaerolineae bacterium]|nr:DUF1761 domain-containing protein [Gemmatimonadaceae bacterium]